MSPSLGAFVRGPSRVEQAGARQGSRRRDGEGSRRAALTLVAFTLCVPAPSRADQSPVDAGLDAWRRAAADVRILAENDAPAAYERARALEASLPANAPAVDRARVLNLLARVEIHLALTARAAEHARRARELAARHGDRVGQAEADLNTALNAINEANFTDLIAAPTRALATLEGVDRPDLLSEAFLRTAAMYRRLGKVEESVTVAMHGMEVARRSKQPLALVYAHQGLGISFDQSFRHHEAREHYGQMLAQAKAAGCRLQQGYATGSLGGVTASLGDLRGGERLIRESIGHYRAVGAPFAVAFGLNNLAYNLRAQHRYAEALATNDEVVAAYERHPNRIGLWFALNFRSESQQSLGNLAAARADVERAYTVAKDIGFPLYMSDSARRVAGVAAASGDHRRAYELTVEAHDVTARAARETASTRMVELAQRYEIESRRREIDALTRRTEQQATELGRRSLQQRWLATIVGGTVAVLAVTIFFLFRLRRSHRVLEAANAQRERAEAEVRALNVSLEAQVGVRTSQLEAANRELESFSYSVSHDLRAPLRSVDGFSRALLEDYDHLLDDEGRDHLRRICAASRHMGCLIDDMLNLARVSRGEMQRTPVDLSALARGVADDLRKADPDRAIEFVIAPDLRATGDPRLLRVVLENLLQNASKFSSTRPAARIECGQTIHNGAPAYFVRDDGVGFDMAYAHKLFGAFQRLHTETEFPGTGIGLATVQRIVHRHGGSVWAESQLGRGATFYFTLPDQTARAA
jgi:signal transduction histidine kinase